MLNNIILNNIANILQEPVFVEDGICYTRKNKTKIEQSIIDIATSLYNKVSYIEKRRNEYPHITEQLDMIYWDKINGTTLWEDAISNIKNKYPK